MLMYIKCAELFMFSTAWVKAIIWMQTLTNNPILGDIEINACSNQQISL